MQRGWDTYCPSYRVSGLWKGVLSVKESFDANVKFCMSDGEKVFFWEDVRVGNDSLAVQFPSLYACARNRQAKAKCYMVQNGEQIHWGPIFRRDLTLFEGRELFSLLDTLDQVACSGEGQAKTQKKPTTKPKKKIQTGTPQTQGSEGTQRDTTTSSH